MTNNHKCRWCSNAFLRDFNFDIKDINSDVLIFCSYKKKCKQNINRINKCKGFEFNEICVITMEEYNETKNRNQDKITYGVQLDFKERNNDIKRHSRQATTK